MIPHRLNLLSPEKHLYLKRMISFQFIKNLLEVLVFALCLAGIVMLGSQWFLQDYFGQLADHLVSVSNRYGQTNQDIKTINQQLNKIEKIQKEYQGWTPLLVELTNVLPTSISLNNLNINQKSATLNLTGTAPARQDLLNLKKQLETLSWLDTVDIPPTQLIEKTNIQFSLSLKIKGLKL